MKPKTKKILGYSLIVILLLVAGTGYYVYKEFNRHNKDTSLLSADYTMTSYDLVNEFEKNDSLASMKYMDKVIDVNGSVKEIAKDEKGYITIVLGDSNHTSSVRCSLDSNHHSEANQVSQGVALSVKGICSGFNKEELLGSDVILVRCVLSNPNN